MAGSLGSVVEIGCGTGAWSRAMIGHHDATDAVLTDVSPDMLRVCRTHLTRLGLASALPIRFATYSAHEACFCDEAFDSCIGTSVVHHITDVRAFLTDVWRILRPGGRAFFTEPSFRYTHVMAMAFADIIALLLSRDSAYSADRQTLHNWVAEARRGTMLQGDLALLEDFEDKHMFIGEDFEALALDVGFATAEALSTRDAGGLGQCRRPVGPNWDRRAGRQPGHAALAELRQKVPCTVACQGHVVRLSVLADQVRIARQAGVFPALRDAT